MQYFIQIQIAYTIASAGLSQATNYTAPDCMAGTRE